MKKEQFLGPLALPTSDHLDRQGALQFLSRLPTREMRKAADRGSSWSCEVARGWMESGQGAETWGPWWEVMCAFRGIADMCQHRLDLGPIERLVLDGE